MLIKIAVVLFFFFSCSCSISQADLDFTWYRMQQEYQSDKSMPQITYMDKEVIRGDGYQIKGTYNPESDIILLYRGYTYDTIIHEMHHAMGNDLGEYAIIPFNGTHERKGEL